jgi:hypothetical protein
MIFGEPGSGKSYWAYKEFRAIPGYAVYIDYTGNTYRDFHAQCDDFYVRGSWDKVKGKFLTLLSDEKRKKVIWHPTQDDDIHAMCQYLWELKEKNYMDTTEIWIFLDEIDLTADLKSPVERMFTKARGCGLRPVGIAQRPSALRNRNIVDNAYGAIVMFRVEEAEVETLAKNYGIAVSEEDYKYIEEFHSYNAVLYDRTLHKWVRL